MTAAASGFIPHRATPRTPLGRHAAIAATVVALHAGLIWTLQSGPSLRTQERVVMAEVLAMLIQPPTPEVAPAPPAPPAPPSKPVKPVTPSVQKKAAPKTPAQPQAQLLAIADPTPSPSAPTGTVEPSASSTPAPAPMAAGPAAPPAPPAPPAVQLPSSNADYLQNPKPAYPPLSKRLGEQGKVMVRVLIGADGQPRQAELKQSSGFERLDQAALSTVMKWRYVPGKRGGVAEDMWFNVPINFVLE
ncbi:MAG: energy transducer TonB [Pseudomonadota bacterium]|nr:energy transducer TonB [Pseudomonadota bacterium]